MKEHSKIKWSELIRKIIAERISILEKLKVIENQDHIESIMTMFASQDSLKRDWDNEADERWNNV